MDDRFVDRKTNRSYESAVELVDAYILRFSARITEALGRGVSFSPIDKDGYTEVSRGSATVGINVLEDPDRLFFMCFIMKVPRTRREDFYRRVLELNLLATGDAAFSIDKRSDALFLRAMRPVADLDYDEFEELLDTVATVADELDDDLIAEFSGD